MQDQPEIQPGEFSPLSHPQEGDWMAFLYGELPRARSAALRRHLRSCAHC